MKTVPKKAKRKRKPVLYELESITRDPDAGEDPGLEALRSEGPFVVEGEVLGSVAVSVPETVTQRSADVLHEKLAEHFGADVLVVTHNVAFLKLRRLTVGEAKKVVKRVQRSECYLCRYSQERDQADNVAGHTVEVGQGEPVVVDKLFGGAIFSTMRLTAVTGRGWVLERLLEHDDVDNEWVEVGMFPGWVEDPEDDAGGA